MIDIERLRDYFQHDTVFVTAHAAERFHQRGIKMTDIEHAVRTGEIIEQYPADYPCPSCLILGDDRQGRKIHACLSDEGTSSRVITAYYPDPVQWSENLKYRKDHH